MNFENYFFINHKYLRVLIYLHFEFILVVCLTLNFFNLISSSFLVQNIELIEYRTRISANQIIPLNPDGQKLKLLQLSTQIFKNGISHKIIPHGLIDDAFNFFNYLFHELDDNDIEESRFRSIKYSLEECSQNIRQLSFIMSPTCPQQLTKFHTRLSNSTSNDPVTINISEIEKNDQLNDYNDYGIELLWKIVDFVHSFCYEDFGIFPNNIHYYETEMEKLFSLSHVQERWHNSGRDNSDEIRRILFPYEYLSNILENVDKIVSAVHGGRAYNDWLKKPKVIFIKETNASDSDSDSGQFSNQNEEDDER